MGVQDNKKSRLLKKLGKREILMGKKETFWWERKKRIKKFGE